MNKTVKAYAVICDSATIPIASCAFNHGNFRIDPFGIFKTKEEARVVLKIAPKPNKDNFSARPKVVEVLISWKVKSRKELLK